MNTSPTIPTQPQPQINKPHRVAIKPFAKTNNIIQQASFSRPNKSRLNPIDFPSLTLDVKSLSDKEFRSVILIA
jgi:hypothetical protein